LLARHLPCDAPQREVAGIKPLDNPRTLAPRVKRATKSIALVGHESHLSALASLLVAGRARPPIFALKKCSVLALERSKTRWHVRWQIAPELIRRKKIGEKLRGR
jgi:phosphohistidine phosphatase